MPLISDTVSSLQGAALEAGLDRLIALEPRFNGVLQRHGVPPLRHVENNLANLLHIVTEQLISLSAAAAIWQRLELQLGAMRPSDIQALGLDGLKQAGLSGAKAKTFLSLAEACASGRLQFPALAEMSDSEAFKALLALPGIGPWTADIYLLTALGRVDIFPAGDRALQLSAQNLFALTEAPTAKALARMAEGWRPWRSLAARLLWSHYRGLKGMPQAIGKRGPSQA